MHQNIKIFGVWNMYIKSVIFQLNSSKSQTLKHRHPLFIPLCFTICSQECGHSPRVRETQWCATAALPSPAHWHVGSLKWVMVEYWHQRNCQTSQTRAWFILLLNAMYRMSTLRNVMENVNDVFGKCVHYTVHATKNKEEKMTDILPVFKNNYSMQQRSHSRHWRISKIPTCLSCFLL